MKPDSRYNVLSVRVNDSERQQINVALKGRKINTYLFDLIKRDLEAGNGSN